MPKGRFQYLSSNPSVSTVRIALLLDEDLANAVSPIDPVLVTIFHGAQSTRVLYAFSEVSASIMYHTLFQAVGFALISAACELFEEVAV